MPRWNTERNQQRFENEYNRYLREREEESEESESEEEQAPVSTTYSAANSPHMGYLNVPEGSENVITYNSIKTGNTLVNFRGNAPNSFESRYGRYYKESTLPGLANKHPTTRGSILNKRRYTARIASGASGASGRIPRPPPRRGTGYVPKSRKSRKSRKNRKSRKSRKTST